MSGRDTNHMINMYDKIIIKISPNETTSNRYKNFLKSLDERFETPISDSTIPVDIRFLYQDYIFDVELKETDDYIASIFNGHLYEQTLSIRENSSRAIILVLGDDEDIQDAVIRAVRGHVIPSGRKKMIMNYLARVQDFEANSFALGIPVLRWKFSPFDRLLSMVHKTLTGGSLLQYLPRPKEDERWVAATCIALPGVGPVRAKSILKKFKWRLEPIEDGTILEDCDGIGQKTAERIVRGLCG